MHNAGAVSLDMVNVGIHMHTECPHDKQHKCLFVCYITSCQLSWFTVPSCFKVQHLACGFEEQFLAFHPNMASCYK